MFAKAYKIASNFTIPVVVSIQFYDGTVESGLASATVINDEGWAITTAHTFEALFDCQKHAGEITTYEQKLKEIEGNLSWKDKRKRQEKARLNRNSKWIKHFSYWYGHDSIKVEGVAILAEADLAIFKMEPWQADNIACYPVLKNPATMKNGTSLCKLGFPFHQVQNSFDEKNNTFIFVPNTFPIPRFPIEGIYTRAVLAGRTKDNKYEVKFIETSTPGLRGQSGGPVFDANGTVWGIQSKTIHLPLGFTPTVQRDGREIEENQFLNVGLAIHSELLIAFLSDNKIRIAISED